MVKKSELFRYVIVSELKNSSSTFKIMPNSEIENSADILTWRMVMGCGGGAERRGRGRRVYIFQLRDIDHVN